MGVLGHVSVWHRSPVARVRAASRRAKCKGLGVGGLQKRRDPPNCKKLLSPLDRWWLHPLHPQDMPFNCPKSPALPCHGLLGTFSTAAFLRCHQISFLGIGAPRRVAPNTRNKERRSLTFKITCVVPSTAFPRALENRGPFPVGQEGAPFLFRRQDTDSSILQRILPQTYEADKGSATINLKLYLLLVCQQNNLFLCHPLIRWTGVRKTWAIHILSYIKKSHPESYLHYGDSRVKKNRLIVSASNLTMLMDPSDIFSFSFVSYMPIKETMQGSY